MFSDIINRQLGNNGPKGEYLGIEKASQLTVLPLPVGALGFGAMDLNAFCDNRVS
jgi:hypothetical protein